eukprot:2642267-Rhodomonas_salina.1
MCVIAGRDEGSLRQARGQGGGGGGAADDDAGRGEHSGVGLDDEGGLRTFPGPPAGLVGTFPGLVGLVGTFHVLELSTCWNFP